MPMPLPAKAAVGTLVAFALMGGGWAYSRDEGDSEHQTTDDAYVQADTSSVGSKVAGTVSRVLVEDNQQVHRGQLLATLDDRDYRVALAAAQSDVLAARANVKGLEEQLARQSDLIDQASATIDSDAAAVRLSQANADRYHDLASDGSASRQEQQEAAAHLASDQAAQRRDVAGHAATRAQLPILAAQLDDAKAAQKRAESTLEAASLNLSYTQIRAPVDGVVGQRTLRVGNYVQVGAPLLAVVPIAQAYVEGRYRETQLARIRPGMPARIKLDALPGIMLTGHVDSVAPATGVSFAAVAPENGTGNFTKITQRIAVRIAFDPNQPDLSRVRVGMSAIPTIQTRD
jgi:membrane fusion protein, multidrug efflux system